MGVREKYLQKIKEQLEAANEKAAQRMADLVVSVSKKANEDDVMDITKSFMEAIEFIPNLSLFAINLILDQRVPIGEKIKIGLLTAFLISPADILLMELIGPLAFMDDIVVVAYLIFTIAGLIGKLDEEVVYDNWVGKKEQVDQFIEAARSISGIGGTPFKALTEIDQ